MRPVTPFMMMPSRTVSTFNLQKAMVSRSSSDSRGRDRRRRRQRRQRHPVGLGTRGEARRGQRAQVDHAVAYRQADIAAVVAVEDWMGAEERPLLGCAGALPGKAIDVVMPIALDVREAEQADQRKVLLDGKTGLCGQVLPGHKGSRA